jgi:murein DD-endopeptidase MepM/ murein hydrolase activator NlpD
MTMRRLLVLPLLLVTLHAEARHPGKHRLPADVSLAVETGADAGLAEPLDSPLPGSRISSGFGWRRHPILRRVRFHGGVDFAAAYGASVLAAGEGSVRSISRARDRGLYVVICHSTRVCSAYSHLSAVTPDLAEGQRIAAGSILGAVGRSGRTTGPHLDFEVFVDGQRVNPMNLLNPPAEAYAGIAPDASDGGGLVSRKLLTFID